jgi:hypothetical protein
VVGSLSVETLRRENQKDLGVIDFVLVQHGDIDCTRGGFEVHEVRWIASAETQEVLVRAVQLHRSSLVYYFL